MRPLTAFTAISIVLLLTSASSAQALTACVNDNSGGMRRVTDPADCTSRETLVSWNESIITQRELGKKPDYVPGEVIVRYKAGVAIQQIQTIETQFALTVLSGLPHLRLRHYKLPEGVTVSVATEQLAAVPEID